jgi:enoyl-CoA hydratase
VIGSPVPELSLALSDRNLTVTLERPNSLNALNNSLLEGLEEVISAAGEDAEIASVILTGSGDRAFSAGADIKEWMANKDYASIERFLLLGHRVFNAMEACRKPIICAVNGVAFGGGLELALACDIRVAADNASFAFPEPNLGAFPGWNGLRRLVQSVGVSRAKEIAMTARRVSAIDALDAGFVSYVVPRQQLAAKAVEVSAEVRKLAPLAVGQIKRLCGLYASGSDGLAGQYLEVFGNVMLAGTTDFHEGEAAFLEKRAPKFTGR